MTTAVLRVSGPQLDLDSCLPWIPTEMLETSWRVGDRRFGRGTCTTSGFNLLLSEDDDRASSVDDALKAFLAVAPHVSEVVQSGASATIDFALYFTSDTDQGIEFPPTFLKTISRYGVSLTVSAYPCSDDEDDPNED